MITQLIIGTTNEAKVKQVRGALQPLNIDVRGIYHYQSLPEVVEDGKTTLENARKKSLTYAAAINLPVLSMDVALYLDSLKTEEQPGVNVRRVDDQILSDEELITYYSALINQLGGQTNGYWEFGFSLASPTQEFLETIIKNPRIFVSRPSSKKIPGYPLESLQIDPKSGKYIAEMSQEEQDEFWQQTIGESLCEFIKNVAW